MNEPRMNYLVKSKSDMIFLRKPIPSIYARITKSFWQRNYIRAMEGRPIAKHCFDNMQSFVFEKCRRAVYINAPWVCQESY
jgi:hypothetical protein